MNINSQSNENKMTTLADIIIAGMTKYQHAQPMPEAELNALDARVQHETSFSLNDLFSAYNMSNITYMNIGKDFNKFAAYLAEAEKEGLLAYYAEEFVEMIH